MELYHTVNEGDKLHLGLNRVITGNTAMFDWAFIVPVFPWYGRYINDFMNWQTGFKYLVVGVFAMGYRAPAFELWLYFKYHWRYFNAK